VTLAIAAVFGLIALALPSAAPAALSAVISYQVFVNVAILVFNMLPAFPLDGGRVARALIWQYSGDISRATSIAAVIGRGLGYAMIGLGVFAALAGAVGGLWLALVGFFVVVAARAEEDGLRVRVAFSGRQAGNLMTFPAVSIPAAITVAEAVRDYFVPRRFSAFPVLDGERLVGILDRATVGRLPSERRAAMTVGEACVADRTLFVSATQDVADLLERPAFLRVGRAVVTTADGGVGIISITDVNRVLAALELAGGPSPRARPA
jgi:CBS domain-containing protein